MPNVGTRPILCSNRVNDDAPCDVKGVFWWCNSCRKGVEEMKPKSGRMSARGVNLRKEKQVSMSDVRVRPTRDEMFMEMARLVAQRSTCLRKQVGAMIVKDSRTVSIGYNGPPAGQQHCTEETCLGSGCDRSIHAEMNVIAFAAKHGVAIEGATMYCTMSPCVNCAKVIINSGISRLVYGEEYRSSAGLLLLDEALLVEKINFR